MKKQFFVWVLSLTKLFCFWFLCWKTKIFRSIFCFTEFDFLNIQNTLIFISSSYHQTLVTWSENQNLTKLFITVWTSRRIFIGNHQNFSGFVASSLCHLNSSQKKYRDWRIYFIKAAHLFWIEKVFMIVVEVCCKWFFVKVK